VHTELEEAREGGAALSEQLRTVQAAQAAGEERHRTMLQHVRTLEAEAKSAAEAQRSAEEALGRKQQELEGTLDKQSEAEQRCTQAEAEAAERRAEAAQQSEAEESEVARVASLEEKLRKLRHLLGMANKRIGESKTLLSNRQNTIKLLTQKQVEFKKALQTATSQKGKLDAETTTRMEDEYHEKLKSAHSIFAQKTGDLVGDFGVVSEGVRALACASICECMSVRPLVYVHVCVYVHVRVHVHVHVRVCTSIYVCVRPCVCTSMCVLCTPMCMLDFLVCHWFSSLLLCACVRVSIRVLVMCVCVCSMGTCDSKRFARVHGSF
jgi:DNA repair exonuclease SbcCD ATPase subunit